jgi:hypothetical protein
MAAEACEKVARKGGGVKMVNKKSPRLLAAGFFVDT